MTELTYRQYQHVVRMKAANVPMDKIVLAIGNRFTAEQIAASVGWWIKHRRAVERKSYRKPYISQPSVEFLGRPQSVPPEVLADRERRATLVPDSTTACLQGDPLPGYVRPAPAAMPCPRRKPTLPTLMFMQAVF